MIKELAKIYDNMLIQHEQMLKEVELKVFTINYANKDFFSLEPMYHEVNNISKDNLRFYPTTDEMPQGKELHICSLSKKEILQTRNFYAKDTYYDSFYINEKLEQWRLELYKGDAGDKPIKVERLRKSDNGLPLCFERYQQDSYWKFDYHFSGDELTVECNYYDDKGNFIFQKVLDVHHSERAKGIESIYCTMIPTSTNNNAKEKPQKIYDYKHREISSKKLLQTVTNAVIEDILTALDQQSEITNDIECLLLEYTCQGPFPPHVGFSGKQKLNKGENPLEYYWVNEMQYQLESELDEKNGDLYDAVNAYFSDQFDSLGFDYEDEKYKQTQNAILKEIFDTYVDICKGLKAKRQLKTILPTTKTFHISARDYEACNEWEFLQILLPKSRMKTLSNRIVAFENGSGLKPEEKAMYEDLTTTLDKENKQYSSLKTALEKKQTIKKYCSTLHHYIEPYGYEYQHKKTADFSNLIESKLLTDASSNHNYYEYYFENGKIVAIFYYREKELWEETYYTEIATGTKKQITYHSFKYFSSGLELDSFTRYDVGNGKILSSTQYRYSRMDKIHYHYDDKKKLSRSTESGHNLRRSHASLTEFRYIYDYDANDQLFKITRFMDEYNKNDVMYCQDDSFIIEHIAKMVEVLYQSIIHNLTKKNMAHVKALVFLQIENLPFHYHTFDVVSLKNNKLSWSEKESHYQNNLDHLTMDFRDYTNGSFFNKITSKMYQKKAQDALELNLKNAIMKKFNLKIEILHKNEFESSDKINNYLLNKYCHD